MLIPRLRLEVGVADKYEYVLPTEGYTRLAEAAELDDSNIDDFHIALRGLSGMRGNWGQYTLNHVIFADMVERHAKIDVYLGQFVGFGEFGIAMNENAAEGLRPSEIDNYNFTAVVLHELFHMSRGEMRERGEKLYMKRMLRRHAPWNIYGQQLDPEEYTVRYLTYQALQNEPTLSQALTAHRAG